MTRTLYLLLLFIASNCWAQSTDTIFLEEVRIEKTGKAIKHIKTKGKTSSLSGNPIKGIISRIDGIPTGKVASITFYFNSSVVFFIPDDRKKDYKDIALGLLIYNVKEDGAPGVVITDKEIRFVLRADHNGSITLDLTPLHLDTLESMYFGIELSQQQQGRDFSIMIKCDQLNPNALYVRNWKNDQWFGFNLGTDACELKTDLKISVKK